MQVLDTRLRVKIGGLGEEWWYSLQPGTALASSLAALTSHDLSSSGLHPSGYSEINIIDP